MEERSRLAICKWLDWSPASKEALQLRTDPLSAFVTLVDVLPPHLLTAAFATPVTTPAQRGQDARVRKRRRLWAVTEQPEVLQLEPARQRYPLLYEKIVGRKSKQSLTQSDPATQDVDVDRRDEQTLTHPEDVMSKPRFVSMMQRLDREEECEEESGKHHQESAPDIEEEDESDEEDEAIQEVHDGFANGQGDIQRFLDAVLASYIQGDDTLPPDLYLCDFDDAWDLAEVHSVTGTQQQTGRNVAISSEDAWFDDEEAS